MHIIDFTRPLRVGASDAYFVNKVVVSGTHVFYVAHGDNYTISPFDVYGTPFTTLQITELGLAGVSTLSALTNTGEAGEDTVYLVKRSGAYSVISDLDSFRESCQIVGSQDVDMVMRIVIETVDGRYASGMVTATGLPVQTILSDQYFA